MKQFDISIIIPIYNKEKFLKRSINSIINQSFDFNRIELILVDNNSNDKSKIIMEKFDSLYDNVKCIYRKENSGTPCTPRNNGIDSASGEFLMFLDADDTYDEMMCEILYNKIIDSGKNIVCCQFNEIKLGKKVDKEKLFCEEELEINPLNNEMLLKNGTYWWMPWDKIYRKSFIDKINARFPPDTLAEDVIFVVQCLLKDETILYLNNYYGYNWNIINEGENASLSHAYSENTFLKFQIGYYILFDLIKGKIEDKYFDILFEQCIKSLYSTFCLLDNCNNNRKKELLEELYIFITSLKLTNIKFDVKWATIFNYFLLKKKFNILITLSKIMGMVWNKLINKYK